MAAQVHTLKQSAQMAAEGDSSQVWHLVGVGWQLQAG
jgi:hypothetical protein